MEDEAGRSGSRGDQDRVLLDAEQEQGDLRCLEKLMGPQTPRGKKMDPALVAGCA